MSTTTTTTTTTTPDALAGTLRDLVAQLRQAEAFTDPDLNPEAINRRREQMRADALERARATIGTAHEVATFKAERAARAATAGASGQDTAADLTARAYAWERARMLLEAGRDLDDVLAGADELTARAVGEWAPTWLRAQTVRPSPEQDARGHHLFTEPDTSHVLPAVAARLAEVAADPAPYVAAHATAAEAERTGLYAEVLGALEGSGRLSGDLANRLNRHAPEAYAAVMGS